MAAHGHEEPPNFKTVRRSTRIIRPGRAPLPFPNRSDYLRYLISGGWVQSEGELIRRPDLVAAIQRHWHQTGQNGCRFAQFLSNSPLQHNWDIVVVSRSEDKSWAHDILTEITRLVDEAVQNPAVQAISIIIPDITSADTLASLLHAFDTMPEWTVGICEELLPEAGPSFLPIEVRFNLGSSKVVAWALGFGPFAFLPRTRRAPFTELALAVKPKAFPLRHPGLNDDPLTAHLADIRVPQLDKEAYDNLWIETGRNKATILGGSNDALAKAKMTYLLPKRHW